MKRKIILALALIAMAVCLFALTASAVEINGVHYTLDNDGTATVNTDNRKATNLIAEIPSEVEYEGKTYKVDTIATDAFFDNTTVTEIRILSEYITKIPSNMIANTYSTGALKKIYIDFSKITSIGSAGLNPSNQTNGNSPKANSFYYYDAKAFLKDGSDVVITCPDFSNCTSIGAAAFQGANFEKLIIPEAVYINNQVFRETTIKELVLQGANREKIDFYSFQACNQLEKITIESRNLKTISNDVFSGSGAVKEIYIDLSKCTSISTSAFEMGNKGYDQGNTQTQWYNLEGKKIVDLSSMKTIGNRAFASSNLGSAEIVWPIALDSISDQAFRRCNINTMIYLNASEGKTITAPFWCFNGNAPTLIVYGEGVTTVNNVFEAQCTAIFLADSITFGNDAKFDKAGSTLYCKSSVDSSKYSNGTVINFTSGTVDYFGGCGLIAELTTAGGDVVLDKTTHNYTLVDYDNTYCPINTMGNYRCSKCEDEKQVANEGTNPVKDGHAYDTVKSIVYADGFLKAGVKTTVCKCTLEKAENVNAIFVFNGYSTKENGTAICVGYTINNNELKDYNSVNTPLTFGAVASIEAENVLSVDNGTVKGGEKTVVAPISSEYASFDFIISGFSAEQNQLALVMCAYVYDGKEIVYLGSTSATSPYTITLQAVIDNK
ncbi:MAG: leucine-rich repeat protein [Clostridia bacterium]|nr:leucine-rich repeat protein [Clostridia bacterium]